VTSFDAWLPQETSLGVAFGAGLTSTWREDGHLSAWSVVTDMGDSRALDNLEEINERILTSGR
jgi:hypothetical protein